MQYQSRFIALLIKKNNVFIITTIRNWEQNTLLIVHEAITVATYDYMGYRKEFLGPFLLPLHSCDNFAMIQRECSEYIEIREIVLCCVFILCDSKKIERVLVLLKKLKSK